MMVCPDCLRHGESVVEVTQVPVKPQEKTVTFRTRGAYEKDIYKGMDKELVSDWPVVIREARKKKGLSREELGFRIGERTVIIAKLENGDLRPSDKMIEKLEKELGISLLESVREAPSLGSRSSGSGLTLGDFVKQDDE
jgi:putative transcription factor